ncbi:MAG: HAD family hydrolase [Acholeplasmatales bacterium]|jgi:phosphoglycolate phosphatase|nr:HAD family hydrolase [Acholeplasmatales bacterium]
MIKGILFDLDGTVLNSIEDIKISLNYVLKKHGYTELKTEFVKSVLGFGAYELIRRLPIMDKDFEVIFSEYKDRYQINLTNKSKAYDGILPMLRRLKEKGIKISLVSNKEIGKVRLISRVLFDNIFDFIIGTSNIYKPKPDTGMLNKTLQELHLEPSDCIYVGDTEVDYETAKNSKLVSIGVTWGFRPKEALEKINFDYLVDKVEDLEEILSR